MSSNCSLSYQDFRDLLLGYPLMRNQVIYLLDQYLNPLLP